jgi:hypothetical protein
MTEVHELDLEGYSEGEKRFRECLVAQIAEKVSTGDITDDNPSPTNGYTSLEQLLRFSFLITDDETLYKLKESVNEEVNKCSTPKDDEIKRLIEKYSKLPKKLLLERDKSRIDLITSIAKKICEGEITDDNPSPTNGYTALDQIVQFYFSVEESDYNRLEKIRDRVFKKIEKYKEDPDRFCMY